MSLENLGSLDFPNVENIKYLITSVPMKIKLTIATKIKGLPNLKYFRNIFSVNSKDSFYSSV